MTEWTVVGVIIALVGLISAVAKPFNTLSKSIAELNVEIQALNDYLKIVVQKNEASHDKLWMHNEKQDEKIQEHEVRIGKLEEK